MTSFAKHTVVLSAALIATTALAEKSGNDKSATPDPKVSADKKSKKGKGSKPADEPEAPPKKIDVPVIKGHPSKGMVIPYYTSTGRHEMQFHIGVASRLDENHIDMTDLDIETFDEDGDHEMQIFLPTAILDTDTSVVTSKQHVTIKRADFELTGESVIFNTRTKQGGLGGNVRMLIYNLKDQTSDADQPGAEKPAATEEKSKLAPDSFRTPQSRQPTGPGPANTGPDKFLTPRIKIKVIKNRLLILLGAVVVCSSAPAQSTADKPLTEADLLKQIELLNPLKGAATPDPRATPAPRPLTNPAANPLLNPATAPGTPGDINKPPTDSASGGPTNIGAPADPNAKPPTEITALEATFDNKANIAVFIGSVFVKDPQFNVDCDKLTAYLKHEDKPVPAVGAKPATPLPRTPAPAVGPAAGPGAAAGVKKQSTGLDKAIAVTTSDRRVKITQDKVEADGSITHGLGFSDRAEYFATTGDIFLYGMPDVTQGTNRCIATAPETWMKLNRDGRMEAHGPHKTLIIDNSDRDNKPAAQ